jgi:hypothetical protein
MRIMERQTRVSAALPIAFALFASACTQGGSTAGTPADGGQANPGVDGSPLSNPVPDASGPDNPDASGCASIPSSDLPAFTSPATGSIVGAGLSAVVCPGGAFARVESAGAAYDTMPYFLTVDYTVGSTSVDTDFDFQSPTGANSGELDLFVGLSSPSPGMYTSPAGADCGFGAFTYYLPVPSSVDCDGGTDTTCPAGCGRICPAFGCAGIPCEAEPPSISYGLAGSTNCIGDSQPTQGAWTVTLTSVTASDAGTSAGLTYYTPHGTFAATLLAGDGGTDTVQVSATF